LIGRIPVFSELFAATIPMAAYECNKGKEKARKTVAEDNELGEMYDSRDDRSWQDVP
jgi:hypothetical protein